jgi:demethylspheroidene O-methyltransferase
MAARAEALGGDFHRDALPEGADTISLVRVVHDHDDAEAAALLARAHAALPAGGLLLLAEPMAGTPGAEPVGEAYFGVYLHAMGSGRPRRAADLVAMLRAAGFVEARAVATATPLQTGLIIARKAG